MEAHAKLAEPKIAQSGLAPLDERKPLGSDFGSIGKARSKASGSGPIPRGEASALREGSNLCFGEAGIK
jgi:hypothetical protein